MKKLVLIAAMVAALIVALPVAAAPPAHNPNAAVTIEASANPSAVGETVTFTIDGVSTQGNVVTTFALVNLDTSETVRYTISGPTATVEHTFTASGDYFLHVFQQRNGKQVLSLAYGSQTVE